mmetsp:Transcript_19183/g.59140  ORF Transcript_19183/g.59140 Transcript_19183/m.59140 type:complete len:142 (-) Transcript_19183:2462-2887(-)
MRRPREASSPESGGRRRQRLTSPPQSPEQQQRLQSAVSFLRRVKDEFVGHKSMYQALVLCLHDFAESDDAVDMREKGDALLAGRPHLLEGFHSFLPLTHDEPAVAGLGTKDDPLCIDLDEEEEDDDGGRMVSSSVRPGDQS